MKKYGSWPSESKAKLGLIKNVKILLKKQSAPSPNLSNYGHYSHGFNCSTNTKEKREQWSIEH